MNPGENRTPFTPEYEPISSDDEDPPSIPPPAMRYSPNTKFMSNLDLLAEIAYGRQLLEELRRTAVAVEEASMDSSESPLIIDECGGNVTTAAVNREANNNETKPRKAGNRVSMNKDNLLEHPVGKTREPKRKSAIMIGKTKKIDAKTVHELSVKIQKRKYATARTQTLSKDVTEYLEVPTRNRKAQKLESETGGKKQSQIGQKVSNTEKVPHKNSQFQKLTTENAKNLPNNIRLHVPSVSQIPRDFGLGDPDDLAFTDFNNQNRGNGVLGNQNNRAVTIELDQDTINQNNCNAGLGNPNDLAFTIIDDENLNGNRKSKMRHSPRSIQGKVYMPFMPRATSISGLPIKDTRGIRRAARMPSPVPFSHQNQPHKHHGNEDDCEGGSRRCIGNLQHFSFAGIAPTFSGLRESLCVIKLGKRPWPNLEIVVELDWRKAPILAANFHGLTSGRPVYVDDKRNIFFGVKELDWGTRVGGRLKGFSFQTVVLKFPMLIQFGQDDGSDVHGFSSFISVPEWMNDENKQKNRNRILNFEVNQRSKNNYMFDGAVFMRRQPGEEGIGSAFSIFMSSLEDRAKHFPADQLGLVFGKVVQGLEDLRKAAENKVGVKGKVLGSVLRPITSEKKVFYHPTEEG